MKYLVVTIVVLLIIVWPKNRHNYDLEIKRWEWIVNNWDYESSYEVNMKIVESRFQGCYFDTSYQCRAWYEWSVQHDIALQTGINKDVSENAMRHWAKQILKGIKLCSQK